MSTAAMEPVIDADRVGELASQFRTASVLQVESVLAALLVWAGEQPAAQGLDRLRVWRDRIEVCRSQVIARQQDAGVEGAALDRLIGRNTTTRTDRNRAKKRAETLGRNANLADEVSLGRLTADQLDAICDADARTDGKAATDPDLLADITAAPADAARKSADAFVKAQRSADDLEQRRRSQRKQRCVRRGTTADGLASLTISGDDESVHHMWTSIVGAADAMYRPDGGRHIAASKHARTDHQRLFDAASEYLTRVAGRGTGPRPVIVVTATKLAGRDDDDEPAELIGVGPIADTLLQELACDSDLVGMVFSGEGEVLWHGRSRRHAAKAQLLALVARDRGCVLCRADPQRCQAHHLMPWSAPGKGTTDIDNLALMCGTCHRDLHDRRYTLFRDPTHRRWRTRPATSHETPRPKPMEKNAEARWASRNTATQRDARRVRADAG